MIAAYKGDGRHSDNCVACGSRNLIREWSVTSSFFAERALLAKPELAPLRKCINCRTRYFDIVVTDEQLGRLYSGYRGDEYFRQRNGFEPWYTRADNDGIGGDAEMQKRREVLTEALKDAGVAKPINTVLDHGGDRGQMLKDLPAKLKAVFEISGIETNAGIESINEQKMRSTKWDLIISCHVLEHLTSPSAYVKDMVSLGGTGTIFFFEIPDEMFESFNFNRTSSQKSWLLWVVRRPSIFMLFDFLSTLVRIKLHLVPPFLFVALREHLTFFSIDGIVKLLENNGLKILSARVRKTGHIGVLAIKT